MSPTNGLSVDVEDWFQVQAFAGLIDPATWDTQPCRVEANMDRMLALFATAGVHATFFTLGWVAERYPAIPRAITAAGHELASHGHAHQLVHTLTPEQFRADVARAKATLEDLTGTPIAGYRAPTFSIGPRNAWAWDVLEQTGHRYSSSVYPVKHDLYGVPDAPRTPYRPTPGSIIEIPMTTTILAGRNIPISGGGYFRLMPYPLFRTLLRRYLREGASPAIFYTHPWEIDPGQPDLPDVGLPAAPALSRFRHRVNLSRTAPRIAQMLREFRWDRIDRAFASQLTAPADAHSAHAS